MGFEALSRQELERIAAMDSVPIEEVDLPGGGLRARLIDPDGNEVDIVYGISKQSAPPSTAIPVTTRIKMSRDSRLGQRVGFNANLQPLLKD